MCPRRCALLITVISSNVAYFVLLDALLRKYSLMLTKIWAVVQHEQKNKRKNLRRDFRGLYGRKVTNCINTGWAITFQYSYIKIARSVVIRKHGQNGIHGALYGNGTSENIRQGGVSNAAHLFPKDFKWCNVWKMENLWKTHQNKNTKLLHADGKIITIHILFCKRPLAEYACQLE